MSQSSSQVSLQASPQARIYSPSKTAMQSGRAKTGYWILEFNTNNSRFKDPLMGWVGSTDTSSQVRLKFTALPLAIRYAQQAGLSFSVEPEQKRKLQRKSYSDNFSFDRLN